MRWDRDLHVQTKKSSEINTFTAKARAERRKVYRKAKPHIVRSLAKEPATLIILPLISNAPTKKVCERLCKTYPREKIQFRLNLAQNWTTCVCYKTKTFIFTWRGSRISLLALPVSMTQSPRVIKTVSCFAVYHRRFRSSPSLYRQTMTCIDPLPCTWKFRVKNVSVGIGLLCNPRSCLCD